MDWRIQYCKDVNCSLMYLFIFSNNSWRRQYTLFKLFNWRMIAFQCCVGFCHTIMRISHKCVCVCVCVSACAYIYSLRLDPLSQLLSHPSRWSLSARLGTLCCIAASHQLSVLHVIVYICQCYSLNLSHPLLPLLCPQVHSPCPHLPSFPANSFISTIFPDFTSVQSVQSVQSRWSSRLLPCPGYCK